jgi:hypothetical protein
MSCKDFMTEEFVLQCAQLFNSTYQEWRAVRMDEASFHTCSIVDGNPYLKSVRI